MNDYIHKVHYCETDMMGITHHSNYVRWLEEAREDFLNQLGYGLKRLGEDGVTSPVVSVECQYKHTTTFDDDILIRLWVEQYTGVKLAFGYELVNTQTGQVVLTAKSSHCFIDRKGTPIAVRRRYPELDSALKQLLVR